MGERRHIITTCTRDCPNTCGLIATVEDGRIIRLSGDPDHPLTRGVACVKCARYVKRVYSPERITHPMVRSSRKSPWQRTTWDQALDLIALRMTAIRDASGPEAILYYQGYGERTALKLLNKYFFNLFGGVTTTRGSLCGGTGQASQNLDFGERVSHDPLDHYNSASMILWARNPVSTNISLVPVIHDIRKRGGNVIVVDPAPSKTVPLASRHIRPKAGTDAFLAMAAAKLILAAGAEDRTFLAQHSVGTQEYLGILDQFSVEDLCLRCGVTVADAQFLAETLMRQKPTSILLGWGLHRHEHAHYSLRAIDALGAISGNIGIAGGGVSQGFEEYGPYDQHYWGDSLNPPRRSLRMPTIGEDILNAHEPPIRMIYVTASNPVCMAPNSGKVAQAFSQAEFVVYSGHFMDDTADHAHVFLPATTFLEEQDVMASYGHNYVGPVNQAIAPVDLCRSEFHMFHELAARFPFAERFRRPVRDWLHDLCAPLRANGCDMDTLATAAFRYPAPMVPYTDKTFATPSGKYQFMTEFSPELLEKSDQAHPYRLLTIAPHGSICSERTMTEHPPLPVVFLATAEAARLGLAQGDTVTVRSAAGAIRATLRTQEGQRPDVLVAERGGWMKAGHGLNRLTRDLASVVGLGTPYYETCVAVEPSSGPPAPRILVVQHDEDAPGGNFCKSLERAGARLTTVMPGKTKEEEEEGEEAETHGLPQTPQGWDGLVVLGGAQHAGDDAGSPHFPALLRLMRAFDAARKPVAGICLGSQLLARAWGGTLRTMDAPEFGFIRFTLTDAARLDSVFHGVDAIPPLMSYHEDAFGLPHAATLLVSGEQCPNQCFRAGNVSYGFQFHLEADSAITDNWIRLFSHSPANAGTVRYDEAFFRNLRADLPVLVEQSERFCRTIAENWLRLARRE